MERNIQSALPDYTYEDLDVSSTQIRLFTLSPPNSSPDSEIIRGTLKSVDLRRWKYKALSYEWGDPNLSRTIVVDGMKLYVTENLWQALFHLQKDTRLPIWIDSICINQCNLLERNHQVSMMKEIYGSASMVLSWLGTGIGQTPSAISSLEIINNRSKWGQAFSFANIPDSLLSNGDDPLQTWHPLPDLLLSPTGNDFG
jgi:hypothetical protein